MHSHDENFENLSQWLVQRLMPSREALDACRSGDVQRLQRLHAQVGLDGGMAGALFREAILSGQLDAVRWLHENGFSRPVERGLLCGAVRGTGRELVLYLQSRGLLQFATESSINSLILAESILADNCELFEAIFLEEEAKQRLTKRWNAFVAYRVSQSMAAASPKIVGWLLEHFRDSLPTLLPAMMVAAIDAGDVNLVRAFAPLAPKYWAKLRAPVQRAVMAGAFEVLQILAAAGCPFSSIDARALQKPLEDGHIDMVLWLLTETPLSERRDDILRYVGLTRSLFLTQQKDAFLKFVELGAAVHLGRHGQVSPAMQDLVQFSKFLEDYDGVNQDPFDGDGTPAYPRALAYRCFKNPIVYEAVKVGLVTTPEEADQLLAGSAAQTSVARRI